jgi:hypothetical protein
MACHYCNPKASSKHVECPAHKRDRLRWEREQAEEEEDYKRHAWASEAGLIPAVYDTMSGGSFLMPNS